MTARHDVSTVPLQGSYVAKQCPVRAQNDILMPCAPAEPDAFQQRLFDKGNAFEAEVGAELLAIEPQALVVEGGGTAAEEATLAAMRSGAPLILNGRLRDEAGRRVGKPDLLVRCAAGGFYPVDIKWHMALDVAKPDGTNASALVSRLSSPAREAAADDTRFTRRRHEDDVLQLAHYRRMLEAVGMAATDARWAGIIGVERQVVWHDLDAPMWRTPSLTETTKLRTTMERYDFDFRRDIIAVAEQHLADPTVDLLVVPVRCGECPTCPWNPHCRPILEAAPGDVSLLPRVGWSQWKAHRDRGVTNRAELAALDITTAELVAAKLDLAGLIEKVEQFEAAVPIRALEGLWLQPSEVRRLMDAGIVTCGDLRSLDAATVRYTGAGMASLPDQIDLARAAVGPAPAYRRRGVEEVVVPRADLEVDVDMENTEVGVYLWGTLVTRRAGPGNAAAPEYVPFVTWEPLTPEVEATNSLAFWRWLVQPRADAHASGLTFAAYCWNASAENQYLRRLGLVGDIAQEVEAFIASNEWVDLLRVWDGQLITGGPSGLKVVAPIVGMEWTVDDPGGGETMLRYDIAVGGANHEEQQLARRWLLDYNHGDVAATLAIRRWLSERGGMIAGIESLNPSAARRPAAPDRGPSRSRWP